MITSYFVVSLVAVLMLLILGKIIYAIFDTKRADKRWEEFNERYEYRDGEWREKKDKVIS